MVTKKKLKIDFPAYILICGVFLCALAAGIIAGFFAADKTEARADDFFAYAYHKSGDALSAGSGDEIAAAAASYPVTINGTVTAHKYVIVEGGTPRLTTRYEYNAGNPQIFVYIPEITINAAYSADSIVNDLVRFVDSPVTNLKLRTDYAITAGEHTGLTLSLYPSNENASASASSDDVHMQIYDGSTWHDIWLAERSKYNITTQVADEADPDLSKCSGITASIEDWSVNAITGQVLNDLYGFEVSLNGAVFTNNTARKAYKTSDWMTNLPEGLETMVAEGTGYVRPSSLKIRFAEKKRNINSYAPKETSQEQIRISIPLSSLTVAEGSAPWEGISGEVVCAINPKAVYNIFTPEEFIDYNKPMVVSSTVTGVYAISSEINAITYLPIREDNKAFSLYVPASMVETDPETGKLTLNTIVTMSASEDDLIMDREPFKDVEVSYNTPNPVQEGIYKVTVYVPADRICAKRVCEGKFTIKVGSQTLDQDHTFITYEIYEDSSELPEDEENGGNETGDEEEDDDSVPTGPAIDIWVNGKDNKKANIFNKSMSKDVSDLIESLPTGCKYVTSVTDTSVEEAAGAFSSGKGRKSDMAKASVKDGKVTVTAGKTAGTVRIWVAAIDKQKQVQASGYFDLNIGTAPKKIYLTEERGAEAASAVKSVVLNKDESVKIYANAVGMSLSQYSEFVWTALKEAQNIEITLSRNTQSATIKALAAPAGGKAVKAPVSCVSDESYKKAKLTVIIANELETVEGFDEALTLDSAASAKVTKNCGYVLKGYADTLPVTDKIKVYVTSALTEGSGYSVNNNKFSLSAKSSDVKATYKDGNISLTVKKGTADGTKVRVLIAATHADKTVSVFESGVITIESGADD